MFGCGTFTLLFIYAVLGPTVCFVALAMAIALATSFICTMYRAELSDKTLTQDLALLKRLFDTDTMLLLHPTRADVISYYTRTTDIDYQLLALFIGPGLHTQLTTDTSIRLTEGNARQVMHVLKELAEVHGAKKKKAATDKRKKTNTKDDNSEHDDDDDLPQTRTTRVLEIGFGRGYCTLMLAGLLRPTNEYEFHGIDIVQRHVDVARADAAAANLMNVDFRMGDAAMASSYSSSTTTSETPPLSYDLIFAVESLCHAADTPQRMHAVLTAAAQHLAPGGRLVIIDGFRSEHFDSSPPDQQLAMRLAERAFSIHRMHPMSEWIEGAFAAGRLRLTRLDCLTTQALPFWTLGWRVAHALLRHTPAWVIRRLRASPRTVRSTDSLLAVATVAHAMRNRAAAVYGVMVFEKARK